MEKPEGGEWWSTAAAEAVKTTSFQRRRNEEDEDQFSEVPPILVDLVFLPLKILFFFCKNKKIINC